jgi:hypothetical protein
LDQRSKDGYECSMCGGTDLGKPVTSQCEIYLLHWSVPLELCTTLSMNAKVQFITQEALKLRPALDKCITMVGCYVEK